MKDLSLKEQVIILTAIEKRLKRQLDQHTIGTPRYECDMELLADYEASGIKGRELRLFGEKVGSESVVVRKPKVVPQDIVFSCDDMGQLKAWEDADFETYTIKWLGSHMDVIARDYFAETGVIADGCSAIVHEEREVPQAPYVSRKVDDAKVAEQLIAHAELPVGLAGLLVGGIDG